MRRWRSSPPTLVTAGSSVRPRQAPRTAPTRWSRRRARNASAATGPAWCPTGWRRRLASSTAGCGTARSLATPCSWWATRAGSGASWGPGSRPEKGSATLVRHRLDGVGGGIGVEVLAAPLQGLQVLVEPVDKRDAGGDVQPDDGLLGHPVEVLDQGTQRVAVRGHTHGPAVAQVRHDRVVPVGQHPLHDVGEALGAGDDLVRQGRVRRRADLRPLVVVGDRRGRGVVGAAPEHELLLAVLLERRLLVLALQGSVVPLVEAP